jgi:hypothetical protein
LVLSQFPQKITIRLPPRMPATIPVNILPFKKVTGFRFERSTLKSVKVVYPTKN